MFVRSLGTGSYEVKVNANVTHVVELTHNSDGTLAAHIDGSQRAKFSTVRTADAVVVTNATGCYVFKVQALPRGFGDVRFRADGASVILSPMPGKVSKFLVQPGTVVEAGQPVLVVEAMKMEHVVKSPSAGAVKFNVREGVMCGADEQLATIVAAA